MEDIQPPCIDQGQFIASQLAIAQASLDSNYCPSSVAPPWPLPPTPWKFSSDAPFWPMRLACQIRRVRHLCEFHDAIRSFLNWRRCHSIRTNLSKEEIINGDAQVLRRVIYCNNESSNEFRYRSHRSAGDLSIRSFLFRHGQDIPHYNEDARFIIIRVLQDGNTYVNARFIYSSKGIGAPQIRLPRRDQYLLRPSQYLRMHESWDSRLALKKKNQTYNQCHRRRGLQSSFQYSHSNRTNRAVVVLHEKPRP